MSAMSSMIRLAKVLPEKVALPVRWAVSVMFADNDPLNSRGISTTSAGEALKIHAKFKQYNFLHV